MSSSSTNRDSKAASPSDFAFDALATGILFAVVVTLVQRLVGFMRGILFCRYLSESELGQWSLVWTALMLLAPFAVLGLPGSFGRYIEHYRRRSQLKSYLLRIALVSIVTTTGMVSLLVLFRETASNILFRSPENADLIMALAFTMAFAMVLNFCTSLMEAFRQARIVTWMRFSAGISFAVFALGSVILFDGGPIAVTLGFAGSCVVGLLPAVWFLTRNRHVIERGNEPLPRSKMWARVAPYAAWLWMVNILSNMYESADRFMLMRLAGDSAEQAQAFVGQYHSALVLPLLLVSITTVICGLILPHASAAWESNRRDDSTGIIRLGFKFVGIGFTFFAALLMLLAPPVFEHVLLGRYAEGLGVLPIVLTYCVWYSLVLVAHEYLWCIEKGKVAVLAFAIGVGANLVLNALLIPKFGLSGAVTATTVANLICLAATLILVSRYGWKLDRGMILVALLPVSLLAGWKLAILLSMTSLYGAHLAGWLCRDEELARIRAFIGEFVSRTGLGKKAPIETTSTP